MYRITFYRSGKYPHLNRKGKGSFVKEFKTLGEIAKFICNAHCVYITSSNLTREEQRNLTRKIISLYNREYWRSLNGSI